MLYAYSKTKKSPPSVWSAIFLFLSLLNVSSICIYPSLYYLKI